MKILLSEEDFRLAFSGRINIKGAEEEVGNSNTMSSHRHMKRKYAPTEMMQHDGNLQVLGMWWGHFAGWAQLSRYTSLGYMAMCCLHEDLKLFGIMQSKVKRNYKYLTQHRLLYFSFILFPLFIQPHLGAPNK